MTLPEDTGRGATRISAGTLALAYALVIVYLSLNPFHGWRKPPSVFAFLFAPLPRYITDFDLFINVIAYVPLGFLATVYFLRYRNPLLALTLGTLCSALLSLVLEAAQGFLPHVRFASNVDLACNALGALVGAALAEWLSRDKVLEASIASMRRRHLYSGVRVDIGLALLLLWLLSQLNPSIPFLGAGLIQQINPQQANPYGWGPYSWTTPQHAPLFWLPQTAAVALNVCGIGLFLSVLMTGRVRGLVSALLLIACAFLLKALAAVALLKPGAGLVWLEAGTSPGLAAGTLLLLATAGLSIQARVACCGIAILAGALMAKFSGVYAAPGTVLHWYDWPYGQMLNFTGLTHTLNEIWPFLAIVFIVFYFPAVRRLHASAQAPNSDPV
jgi:VanZ family protein